MFKVALSIWLFLAAYKIFDYQTKNVSLPEEPVQENISENGTFEEISSAQTSKPAFDPTWKGHSISKNQTPESRSRFKSTSKKS